MQKTIGNNRPAGYSNWQFLKPMLYANDQKTFSFNRDSNFYGLNNDSDLALPGRLKVQSIFRWFRVVEKFYEQLVWGKSAKWCR